jgi:hypothetical protein
MFCQRRGCAGAPLKCFCHSHSLGIWQSTCHIAQSASRVLLQLCGRERAQIIKWLPIRDCDNSQQQPTSPYTFIWLQLSRRLIKRTTISIAGAIAARSFPPSARQLHNSYSESTRRAATDFPVGYVIWQAPRESEKCHRAAAA